MVSITPSGGKMSVEIPYISPGRYSVKRILLAPAFCISLLGTAAGCGGSKATPTAPTNPAKGTIIITDLTVTGTKTGTVYRYAIKVTAQNTETAVANISTTTLAFSAPGRVYGTLSPADSLPEVSTDQSRHDLPDNDLSREAT
jgi:hypothetical protein